MGKTIASLTGTVVLRTHLVASLSWPWLSTKETTVQYGLDTHSVVCGINLYVILC